MKNAELYWRNGQPVSAQFDDIYFSAEDGLQETEHVFLAANDLPRRWQGVEKFVIGETGFGSGLNFFTTVMHWLNTTGPNQQLFYYSVELFPFRGEDLKRAISLWPEFESLLEAFMPQYPPAIEGSHLIRLYDGRVTLCLMLGDVEDFLRRSRIQVDAWYLDGFAPSANSRMWSQDVFNHIARLSKAGATFSTFTVAGFVRRGLQAAGFEVKKIEGFGRKRHMLAGRLPQAVEPAKSRPWFYLPSPKHHKKAVIIGAGIAGLTTAHALLNRGWQVELIEQNPSSAMQASGNPQGLVMPKFNLQASRDNDFYNTAFLYAIARLNQLTKQGFKDWQQSGILKLVRTKRQAGQLADMNSIEGFVKALSAAEASQIAGLDLQDAALWFPSAGYCSPASLCDYLYTTMAESVSAHFNTQIDRLEYQQQWRLFQQGHLVTEADIIILCNAYQASVFRHTSHLDIQPARGQVSLLAENTLSQSLACPIAYEGYVIPAVQGRHLCGASFIAGDNDCQPRDKEDRENIQMLSQVLPVFQEDEAALSSRASVRAVSRDRMPLVGPVASLELLQNSYHDLYKGRPDACYPASEYYPGLYINAAHGARGLVSSFLSAEIIAAQLNNEPLPVLSDVAEALHPSRSIIKRILKRQLRG